MTAIIDTHLMNAKSPRRQGKGAKKCETHRLSIPPRVILASWRLGVYAIS